MSRFSEWFRSFLGGGLDGDDGGDASPQQSNSAEGAPEVRLPSADDLDTPPVATRLVTRPGVESSTAPTARMVGASLAYGWISDVGRVRDHNEDSVFVFVSEQFGDNASPPFGVFLLADGMGGHEAGEVASAMACQTVAAQLMEEFYLPLLYGSGSVAADPESALSDLSETLGDAIQRANSEVFANTPGSGTTLTCGLFLGNQLLIGHVGDSRAYIRRDGSSVELLTNDHSLVKQLVDIGQLSPEAAAVHPRRNILYRAVGQGGALTADVRSVSLEPGMQLLLCTDGLWGLVPDERIWEIVGMAPSVQDACERLAQSANDAGGNDNITVLLVEYQGGAVVMPGDGDRLG